MLIHYRYPHGERVWSKHRTVTLDELWDGSTFDYHPLAVGTQLEYDYLRSMEMMRGALLHELMLIPDLAEPYGWSVEIKLDLILP